MEFLVEQLSSYYNIGVVSRGYKRRTKGYVLASSHSNPETIGDEPYQIYKKFGKRIRVAVCENRRKGITQLLADHPDINLILLDDAFQHRYVKPKVNIMLTDYNNPYYKDYVLPLGRLRECRHNVSRADMVIVTKVPEDIQPLDILLIKKHMDLLAFQKFFFSRVTYDTLQPVFPEESKYLVDLERFTKDDAVLLLTGIANPRSFVRHFKKYPFRVKVSHFPDHHNYGRRDLAEISTRFEQIPASKKSLLPLRRMLCDSPKIPISPKISNL